MRILKNRMNIDKLRLCFNQPKEIFNEFANIKPNTFWERGDYKLFIIGDDEEEETPKKIQVNVLLSDNTLLGHFIFSNSRKYEGKCFFTFNNKALYNCLTSVGGHKYNLAILIDFIADDLGLTLNNITEIEIALDTNINVNAKVRKLIKDFHNFEMIYNGKKVVEPLRKLDDYTETFGRCRKHLLKNPTIYFRQAKKDSPLLRIYNKTEEIKDNKNEKNYINEWNDFGKCDTYRMELRLLNESTKEFLNAYPDELPLLHRLTDPTTLRAMWGYFADRLCYFKADDGTPIHLYDLISA